VQYVFILNHNTTQGKVGMRKILNLWTNRAFAGSTHSRFVVAELALVAALALPAQAQNDKMEAIATPSQPSAIELGTGPLPGATNPEAWHKQYGSLFARNVSIATLTPFLPDPAKASGAAVVVAPGGGFRTLSMENEGWNVARALAEKGVAAFVLKYRLNQTPADIPEFEKSMREMFSGTARAPRPDPEKAFVGLAPQIADARDAFALIRKRSAEWHVDPNRIGMVGFSAGAMLTMATTISGEDAKPAFIGNIYGPLSSMCQPKRRRCSSPLLPMTLSSRTVATDSSIAGSPRSVLSNSIFMNRVDMDSGCTRRKLLARVGSMPLCAGSVCMEC
jgi:acetyl esterase/lipase